MADQTATTTLEKQFSQAHITEPHNEEPLQVKAVAANFKNALLGNNSGTSPTAQRKQLPAEMTTATDTTDKRNASSSSSHASSGVSSGITGTGMGTSLAPSCQSISDHASTIESSANPASSTTSNDAPQAHSPVHYQLPPGWIEDRFQVDRKRLEAMLIEQIPLASLTENQRTALVTHAQPENPQVDQQNGQERTKNPNYTSKAELFFAETMDVTGCNVIWPSRLKIGAKSKKDPHIKITGLPEAMVQARDRILAQLDSKSSRVTIKMDVAHTEHSHVIGKGGVNIKEVMRLTECHIHFPDSNRNSSIHEKSNQVSIAGQPEGVEKARRRIRELLPVSLYFELPLNSRRHHMNPATNQPMPQKNGFDLSSPDIQHIMRTYNITVQVKVRQPHSVLLQVRGTNNNKPALKEGVLCLMHALTGQQGQSFAVSTNVEIQNIQAFLTPKNINYLKSVQMHTGVTIQLPNVPLMNGAQNNLINASGIGLERSILITGTCDGVLLAKQDITGCLPIVLMFDLKNDYLTANQAQQAGDVFECFVSIKSKPKQSTKSCVIKSTEMNVTKIFQTRQALTGSTRHGLEQLEPDQSLPQHMQTLALPIFQTANGGQQVVQWGGPTNMMPQAVYVNPMVSQASSSPRQRLDPTPAGYSSPNGAGRPVKERGRSAATAIKVNSIKKSALQSRAPGAHRQRTGSVDGRSLSDSTPSLIGTQIGMHHSASSAQLSSCKSNSQCGNSGNTTQDESHHSNDCNSSSESDLINPEEEETHVSESYHHVSKAQPNFQAHTGAHNTVTFSQGTFNENPSFDKFRSDKQAQARKPVQAGEPRVPNGKWSGCGFSDSLPAQFLQMGPGATNQEPVGMQQTNTVTQHMVTPVSSEGPRSLSPSASSDGSANYWRNRQDIHEGAHVINNLVLQGANAQGYERSQINLRDVFSYLGLDKYTDMFLEQEIDLETFLTMSDQDLRELGVATFGPRRKMTVAIKDLTVAPEQFLQAMQRYYYQSGSSGQGATQSTSSPPPNNQQYYAYHKQKSFGTTTSQNSNFFSHPSSSSAGSSPTNKPEQQQYCPGAAHLPHRSTAKLTLQVGDQLNA